MAEPASKPTSHPVSQSSNQLWARAATLLGWLCVSSVSTGAVSSRRLDTSKKMSPPRLPHPGSVLLLSVSEMLLLFLSLGASYHWILLMSERRRHLWVLRGELGSRRPLPVFSLIRRPFFRPQISDTLPPSLIFRELCSRGSLMSPTGSLLLAAAPRVSSAHVFGTQTETDATPQPAVDSRLTGCHSAF